MSSKCSIYSQTVNYYFLNLSNNRLVPCIREDSDIIQARMPKAAYISASNGDEPVFFEFFRKVWDNMGIRQRRHVFADSCHQDRIFIDTSDRGECFHGLGEDKEYRIRGWLN